MTPFAQYLLTTPKTEEAWIEGWSTYKNSTAFGHIGTELIEINDERIVVDMPMSDAARQPFGLLHGGVSLLLAESLASMHSAWLADVSKVAPVGIDINGTHLAGESEGIIRAIGKPLNTGRTFMFHEVEIHSMNQNKVLCRARVTNYLRPHGG